MSARFLRAFEAVIGHEGGFTAHPADPGNWTGGKVGQGALKGTKFGISAASYPDLDIANLTLADAQAIYERDYWRRIRGDDLPAPVAFVLFDAAVNNGAGAAVRWLQFAVRVPKDGVVGPVTLGRVAEADPAKLAAEVHGQRIAFMAGLPTWPTFGGGWSVRLARVAFQAAVFS